MPDRHEIEVGELRVEVHCRDTRHLRIGVYPPHGRVRISAPRWLPESALRQAVVSRLQWIRRKQAVCRERHRQSARELVSGESHYFQGRRYRLLVVEHEGPAGVIVDDNGTMELRVRAGSDLVVREAVLAQWYRESLRREIPVLVKKWEQRIGVRVADARIRKMKTRWGTCNIVARRIWLNLELARKSDACLEYVLVHEMVHLLEHLHNERFKRLMDEFMPGWRLIRKELNRAPVAHEEWPY